MSCDFSYDSDGTVKFRPIDIYNSISNDRCMIYDCKCTIAADLESLEKKVSELAEKLKEKSKSSQRKICIQEGFSMDELRGKLNLCFHPVDV